ncbi:hypothetical protein PGSY75_1037900 [Plasmodium gaboni]|uniref:Uncharacterized protein n=1 Tax=Plasmodium gaboni TaxID=647221 RepID=A0A151LLE2_9APIC|nr:hypothetical protein PGSY75_1037900 [Plasmodium gaboni]KYN99748.1 hypothetical protein PGSY75_1037900 [Plasmodium gaboni]SOV23108.1 conserved Plasmodium protein, unknown function [Plasmodium sp. DRC-Itaito]
MKKIILNNILTNKYNVNYIQKKFFSEQIIIDHIRKVKNKLDRGSLYLLQESINNNHQFIKEEKKVKFQKVINELNNLLTHKSYLMEEKIKILNQHNSKGYKNKEIIGLFVTGFFIAIGSISHSIFYLVSVYGIYILHQASKENNSMIYIEKKLNDNKNKLLKNKKNVEDLLNLLENDLITTK